MNDNVVVLVFIFRHSCRTIRTPKDKEQAAAADGDAGAGGDGGAGAPKMSSHFHVMQAARKLFDLSSATTDSDHPLCEECKLVK